MFFKSKIDYQVPARRDIYTTTGGSSDRYEKPEYGIPQTDVGKAHQYSKSKMSDPSKSVDEVNVPEVTQVKTEFVYNFYDQNERVSPFYDPKKLPLSKTARYVTLSWSSPKLSEFETSKTRISTQKNKDFLTIEKNAEKIVSEDNFFNPGYVNHTFSNVDAIEQGASDLENYSRISKTESESVFKMTKYHIKEVASEDPGDKTYKQQLGSLTETYTTLADIPKDSLGLRVYDEKNRLNDDDDLMRSITDSVSISMKINSLVIPDVFKNSKEKTVDTHFKSLKQAHAQALTYHTKSPQSSHITPVHNDSSEAAASKLTHPVDLIGYVIERYLATANGFKKEKEFYIEDIQQTRFEDRTVLYGVTYVYAIKVVASVKMLTYSSDQTRTDLSTIYVCSRSTSAPVECFEYTPPPEPNDIKFTFDYVKRNLVIHWDMPVNPQRDVKQFQVFRRKSIREPFELIAQYGFDMTAEGDGKSRYKTGERVDANNLAGMLPEERYLVREQDPNAGTRSYPVYMHVDEDFTVDTEFYTSSDFIYSVCAVDAHGMISNYSSQHRVVFDPYKNKLLTRVVCDAGSPRQYPNMKLRTDAFKDVISVEGDSSRQLNVYFTPEYLKVRDDRNIKHQVVEGQTQGQSSYYLLQLINLDNQKLQLLKINIIDPENLTA